LIALLERADGGKAYRLQRVFNPHDTGA
jgi:hypothetical protein